MVREIKNDLLLADIAIGYLSKQIDSNLIEQVNKTIEEVNEEDRDGLKNDIAYVIYSNYRIALEKSNKSKKEIDKLISYFIEVYNQFFSSNFINSSLVRSICLITCTYSDVNNSQEKLKNIEEGLKVIPLITNELVKVCFYHKALQCCLSEGLFYGDGYLIASQVRQEMAKIGDSKIIEYMRDIENLPFFMR